MAYEGEDLTMEFMKDTMSSRQRKVMEEIFCGSKERLAVPTYAGVKLRLLLSARNPLLNDLSYQGFVLSTDRDNERRITIYLSREEGGGTLRFYLKDREMTEFRKGHFYETEEI